MYGMNSNISKIFFYLCTYCIVVEKLHCEVLPYVSRCRVNTVVLSVSSDDHGFMIITSDVKKVSSERSKTSPGI